MPSYWQIPTLTKNYINKYLQRGDSNWDSTLQEPVGKGGREPRLSSRIQNRRERPKMTWQRNAASLEGWCSSLCGTLPSAPPAWAADRAVHRTSQSMTNAGEVWVAHGSDASWTVSIPVFGRSRCAFRRTSVWTAVIQDFKQHYLFWWFDSVAMEHWGFLGPIFSSLRLGSSIFQQDCLLERKGYMILVTTWRPLSQ